VDETFMTPTEHAEAHGAHDHAHHHDHGHDHDHDHDHGVSSAEPVEAPRFWRTLEERAETPEARQAAEDEFLPGAMDPSDPPPVGLSRRNFFQLAAAGAALAATTACEPKGKGTIVPYTKKPVEVVPGVANYYASAFQEGRRVYPVLVKTREGRPIHLAGNDEHPGVKGKTSPRAMADLLRLYDPDRLRQPMAKGRPLAGPDAAAKLRDGVKGAVAAGKGVLLLTGALASPTRRAVVQELKKAYPGLEHLAWEPAEGDAQIQAALASFGQPVEIRPRLEEAQVVLSLGCDFLNGDDPEATRAFAARRRLMEPGGEMNRLWVLEGPMTLTGGNADERVPVRPSRLAAVAFALAKDLNGKHGITLPAGADLSGVSGGVPSGVSMNAALWDKLLHDLKAAGRHAAVLCGPHMPAEAQQAAHLLNAMLGSTAVEVRPSETLATAKDVEAALASGRFGALIAWGANPAFALPKPGAWKDAAAKASFVAWIGLLEDETAATAHLSLPESHWLECWNDFEAGGTLCLQQPAIGPLYGTPQGEEILLHLARGSETDYVAFLKERWGREVHGGGLVPFARFFEAALHDGFVASKPTAAPAFKGASVAGAVTAAKAVAGEGFELALLPGTQVHDGRYANNGWLQECPDPVNKLTWTNALSLAPADAGKLGLKDGDIARVEAGGRSLELPVVLQPGQAHGVASVALGYGRETGSNAKGHGANAFALADAEPARANLRTGVKVAATGARVTLPRTQGHHRMEGRDLVRSWVLGDFAHNAEHKHVHDLSTLYPEVQYPEHKWGMVIDLSACVGCSGCVVACQSENNIPVVGPEQVAKGREMHWIRVDRYYEDDAANPENVHAVHQPMLCQHCDHAPCENVCPVNATNHSPDGLNQMAYNRCVGTRYCANNCPYKVRRFNFLEYTADKVEPESLVYNPEVTVRPRGVMEKCTFCVQRIQDTKVRAKGEGRAIRDGEVAPACAVACPAEAIVFGDMNDKNSQVYKLSQASRGYKVLEELGARPAVTYLADLRNPAAEPAKGQGHGGHHAG
jgi:molybdopterin-containing oxidoreductase family iron-sulfur binding subunit